MPSSGCELPATCERCAASPRGGANSTAGPTDDVTGPNFLLNSEVNLVAT